MNKKVIVILLINLFLLQSSNIVIGSQNIKNTSTTIGKTLYVDDDADLSWYNETNFLIIQNAINCASEKDTVYVYNGTYYENILIDKSINLIGETTNNTIINYSSGVSAVGISANYVNIRHFTISTGDVTSYGIFLLNSNCVIIKDNIITNSGHGLIISGSTNCAVLNNKIIDNLAGSAFFSTSNINVSNNTIKDNSLYAFSIWDSNNDILYRNKIENNEKGVLLFNSNNNEIIKNNIKENQIGVQINSKSNKNKILENNFIKCNISAIHIQSYRNTWNHNFWDKPRLFPKPIFGYGLILPRLTFDLHPAKEPYEI